MATPAPAPATIAMIRRLVGFDTTSRESNLALVDFVRAYLDGLGVESELVHDESGRKANLYATIGPKDRRGICISGHTDVVPVDGQDWASEPFALAEKDGKLYGRGTADMKSWIAVALVFAPEFARRRLETPIHLAFSYDEEVGCLGVRGLLARLSERPHKPALCIVGEPTEMKVARAHKGKHSYRCRVSGLEAHSALTHKGVNAVEAAAELVARLKAMARQRRDHGPHDDAYDPPYTTVHTGVIRGGTALNIVPKACSFDFEFRHIPSDPPEALFEQIRAYADAVLLPEMRRVSGAAGFAFDPLSVIPALDAAE
ncbi:MAG: acetylornithine deacetylase, partial [Alphaproteobacteria bacterium]